MSPDPQSPFAAGLHMTADQLERDVKYLRRQAEKEQWAWDRYGDVYVLVERLEHERDELRAEVERMRPVVEAGVDYLHAWRSGLDAAALTNLRGAVRDGGGS